MLQNNGREVNQWTIREGGTAVAIASLGLFDCEGDKIEVI
jgi:hypothetical protein